jgi:hypothetical protein
LCFVDAAKGNSATKKDVIFHLFFASLRNILDNYAILYIYIRKPYGARHINYGKVLFFNNNNNNNNNNNQE